VPRSTVVLSAIDSDGKNAGTRSYAEPASRARPSHYSHREGPGTTGPQMRVLLPHTRSIFRNTPSSLVLYGTDGLGNEGRGRRRGPLTSFQVVRRQTHFFFFLFLFSAYSPCCYASALSHHTLCNHGFAAGIISLCIKYRYDVSHPSSHQKPLVQRTCAWYRWPSTHRPILTAVERTGHTACNRPRCDHIKSETGNARRGSSEGRRSACPSEKRNA
jgi:hypothetical protein